MASIKIPTPLRAYTGGAAVIEVTGSTVGEALSDLVGKHDQLRQHIYEDDELRSFVNIFIGEEDIRYLDGLETDIEDDTQLRIIPSIAGGNNIRKVDHSALRTNQAIIISLLLVAFIFDISALVAVVAAVLLAGAFYAPLRLFLYVYKLGLKPAGIVKPDVIDDNPEPHRFSMLLGGIVSGAAFIFLAFSSALAVGWGLALLVVALASLNLFLGFCAGCFVYYQLNKLGVPGFSKAPVAQQ